MTTRESLDCVVIGYNEMPFDRYESFLRNYGEDSEAYRDLKFSFVDLGRSEAGLHGPPELCPHAGKGGARLSPVAREEFLSGDIPNLAAVYLTNFLRNHGCQAHYMNLFSIRKRAHAGNRLCAETGKAFSPAKIS